MRGQLLIAEGIGNRGEYQGSIFSLGHGNIQMILENELNKMARLGFCILQLLGAEKFQ